MDDKEAGDHSDKQGTNKRRITRDKRPTFEYDGLAESGETHGPVEVGVRPV